MCNTAGGQRTTHAEARIHKISKTRNGALTLVNDSIHGVASQVAFALGQRQNLNQAVEDHREREGTTTGNIGYLVSVSRGRRYHDRDTAEAIRSWVEQRDIDAVIWADLPSNF